MAITETRARITVVDNATSGLNQIARANERMMSSLNNGGRSLAQFNTELSKLNTASAKGVSNMADSFDEAAKSVSNMDKMVNRLIYSVMRYTVIYEGIKKMGDLWGTIVGGAYDYANMIETNQIGMAGILSSMTKIDGKQTTWNQAMKVSAGVMKDLQSESLKTAATAQELIDTFRALLGPGLASGMTVKQIEKLTTVGTNAVKSLGLPSNQIIQELRDLVAGGIRPSSSTLATSLGITDADIKAAKQSTEGLYSFLINKMKGFEMATTQTSNTVAGKIDQIKEGLQRGIAEGMAPLRNVYSDVLDDIAKKLVVIDKTTHEWKINPDFESSLFSISATLIQIGEKAKNVWKFISPAVSIIGNTGKGVLGSVVNNLGLVVAGFTAFKTKNILKDLIKIATMNRFDYNAQTSIGKAIQGIRDKITGRIEKHKEEIALQKREKELIDGAVNSYAQMLHNAEQAYSSMKTLSAMVDTPNSVTNLAAKWQGMGMSKAEAVARQNNIVGLVNKYGADGYDKYIKQAIEAGDKAAEAIQKQNELLKAQEAEQERILKLYDEQMKSIDKIVSAERGRKLQVKDTANAELAAIDKVAKAVTHTATRGDKAKYNVDSYLSLDTSTGPYKTKEGKYIYAWEQDAVDKLRTALEQLGLQYEVVQVTSERFMNSLHASMKGKVQPVFEQAINSARLWNETLTKAYQGVNMSAAEINYKAFMGMGKELVPAEQKNTAEILLNEISQEFKQVGMSAQEAQAKALDFVNQFILSLQKIDPKNIFSVTQVIAETQDAAQRYAENFRLVAEHTEEVKQASAEAAIEINALKNAFKIGGEESYQAVRRVVEESKNLQQALMDRGAEEQAIEVHKELANYLTQVAEATDKAVIATKDHMDVTAQATEAITTHTATIQEHESTLESVTNKTVTWMNKISGLAMSLGILMHIVAENSDENKTFANTMADVADKVFIGTMAVSALLDVFKELVKNGPVIIKTLEGIGKAKLFAKYPVLTGIGLVGAAVGGLTWKMYKNGHNQYNSKEGLGLDWFERQGLDFSDLSDTAKQYRVYGDGSYDNGNNSGYDFYADEASNYSKNPVSEDSSNLADRMTTEPKIDTGSAGNGGGTAKAPKMPTMPKTYNVEVPIGEYIVSRIEDGLFGAESEQWRGRLGNDIDGWCADWASTVYSSFETGIGNVGGVDSLSEEFGHAYHEYNPNTFNPKAGDLIKWSHHVGIADGKGGYWARNSRGGVTHGSDILAPQNEGNYGQLMGYGSIGELTGNAQRTMTVGASDKKALEYKNKIYAEVAKIVEATRELNRETAEINETESAYDKTMGEAYKKLNAMQTEVAKGQKMKIDTTALEKAMEEYRKASIKKATQDQQDYNLQMMGLEESRINNLHSLGLATTREQAKQLSVRLANHKAYLEDLLADEHLSAKRRYELEKRLSDVMKQQNDERRYDAQKAWYDHMSDIANSRFDYKSLWENITGGIQDAFVEVLTSTESFSKRMKNLFKSLVSNILSNLARLAVNQLFQRLLGGYNSLTNRANISSAANVQRGQAAMDYANSINLAFGKHAIGKHANGGYVSGGDWTMVGENGPELVRFNKGGMVYNNTATNSMIKPIVNVVVNNNTGSNMRATSKESQDGQGRTITTVILETVTNAMVTNEGGMRDVVAAVR